MASKARFADVKPGDQVEVCAKSRRYLFVYDDSRDPERVVGVAVVTHRWFDPVKDKEYVGLARIQADGSVGMPTIKHTIRGLAQAGWYPAQRDWIAYGQALKAGDVVPFNLKLRRHG
ncbi:MAG: hypothetical protein AAGI34_10355 [Pseudomonadota bacterium]